MKLHTESHPIMASRLNVTFDAILQMHDSKFRRWAEAVRQELNRCWRQGIPPHNGKSWEVVEREFNALSLHPTDAFLQVDENTYRRDVIMPDGHYGSFLKNIFTNTCKSGDGNSDGRSVHDYVMADAKTLDGGVLADRWARVFDNKVRKDGLYKFSMPLRVGSESAHGSQSAADWIRASRPDAFRYWLQRESAPPRIGEMVLSPAELDEFSQNGLLDNITVRGVPIAATTHARIRTYRRDQKMFPAVFAILPVALVMQGTNFPALVAKFLYNHFTEALVSSGREIIIYDPSAGYGGRCLGALAAASDRPIRYIGTDPNSDNWFEPGRSKYNVLGDLYRDLVGQRHHAEVEVFCLGSEVIHEDAAFGEYKGKVDLVFTSPPYFCAELYSKEPTQSAIKFPTYPEWRDGFLRPTLRTAVEWLRPGGVLLWNIANVRIGNTYVPLEEDSLSALREYGMILEQKLKLLLATAAGTRRTSDGLLVTKNFARVNGEQRKYEPIFVFRKPT